MNRRSLLAALGTFFAGCSGTGSNTDDTTTTTATESPTATPTPSPTATPSPTQTPQSAFRVAGGGCRSEPGGATVAFSEGQVAVDGRIEAPNGCYTAKLAGVDQEDDTLTVRVRTEEEGGACVQCLYVVEYGVTVEFAGSGPSTVVVEHDGTEVARAER